MRWLAVSLLLLAAGDPGQSGPRPARNPRTLEAKQLSVTLSQSALAVKPGGKVQLFADVFPKAKMHVYSPEQTGGYIRIELIVDEVDGVRVGKPIFPKGGDYYFAPLNETFKVFDAPFRIRQDLTVATPRRPLTVTATLRYQACDDMVCYRPDEVKLSWTVQPSGARQ